MGNDQLEEGSVLQLDFRKLQKIAETGSEVVPVAVQNVDTGEVILMAYANEQALRIAVETRTAVFGVHPATSFGKKEKPRRNLRAAGGPCKL